MELTKENMEKQTKEEQKNKSTPKLYFAPLEGITGYLYRRIHQELFGGIDQYFMPFIMPHTKRNFNSKEQNELLPEHNKGMIVIPQILTNHAEDFIKMAKELWEMGYTQVNLNLGCPSKTVVAKGRGAGFLSYPKELNEFLSKIFEKTSMKISIKTRIGKESPQEWYPLMEVYNQYPLEELIIHPRTQQDYYKNKPNWTIVQDAVKFSKNPICYNGDIFTVSDYNRFHHTFPNISSIMLGRGMIANPFLAESIAAGENRMEKERWQEFHNRLLEVYQETLQGDTPVLYRMKELWFYMGASFTNSEKYSKKIKKCQHLSEYNMVVAALFREESLIFDFSFSSL